MYINTASFRFNLMPLESLILPSYKGSTLRGGFGYAFKKVVCALKDKECSECLLKEKCIYSYIFETPPPSDTKIMRKYPSAPHPFIIEPPSEKRHGYSPGTELGFGLILIGKAIDYLPYFIFTFDELGRIGIGKGKAKYELKNVICDGKKIYDSETKTLKPSSLSNLKSYFLNLESEDLNRMHSKINLLTINFLTPTRILYNGHLTLDLEFHILIRNLLRRLSLLSYFHCGGDPSEVVFKKIIELAKNVSVKERHLKWYDWERYSTRQDARMKMGGFVGEITFKGNFEPFMQIIEAGEVLHVGKGTAFGLGKYEIREIL
ncbi:MAG: CRISPR system precrRNA processing endoribonuclease RAMP protein Cas6 [Nitrospirae bacterium]|nr:CRISPR system precrRNA processing endoribonuclease RAMP protein Cas6 [Nitrospirota bacterium]